MPPPTQSSWSNCSHRPALFWGSVFIPLPLLARCQPPSMEKGSEPVEGHLGYFQIGVMMNKSAINKKKKERKKRGVSTAEKKTWTRGTYAHLGSWSQEVLASLPSLPTAPPPSTGSEDPHPPFSQQAVHQELPPFLTPICTGSPVGALPCHSFRSSPIWGTTSGITAWGWSFHFSGY